MTIILKNVVSSATTANLYLNEKYTDVIFKFENEKMQIPANKIILAALSPVFHTMFFANFLEAVPTTAQQPTPVPIEDATYDEFIEFIQFFYLPEVTMKMENFGAIHRLADKYNILQYFIPTFESIEAKLTVDNMCWGYQVGLFLNSHSLIEFCERKLIISPREILATEDFEQFEKDSLRRVLSLNLLCDEIHVFNACLRWAQRACVDNHMDENNAEHIRNQLGDCFKLIRFGALNWDEFLAISTAFRYLFTVDEVQDITFSILKKGYEPKIFSKQPRKAWNPEKLLICKRELDEQSDIFINDEYTVKFRVEISTNETLFLSAIHSAETFDHIRVTISFFHVIITDITHNSTIYGGFPILSLIEEDTAFKMTLQDPIQIEPGVIYQIEVKLPQFIKRFRNERGFWGGRRPNETIEKENGVRIKFLGESNPYIFDYISALVFIKI